MEDGNRISPLDHGRRQGFCFGDDHRWTAVAVPHSTSVRAADQCRFERVRVKLLQEKID